MALTSLQRTTYEAGAVILVLVASVSGWNLHERAIGQRDLLLHAADSTAKLAQDSVAIRSEIAQEAVNVAEQARDKATAQIAAGRRLQAHTDSLIQQVSDARAHAEQVVADSLASLADLRAGLTRLIDESRADSLARYRQAMADSLTIRALLQTLHADSVSSVATDRQVAALAALNASTVEKVKLLTQAQPSTFGKILRYTALAAISVEAGRMSAGKLP